MEEGRLAGLSPWSFAPGHYHSPFDKVWSSDWLKAMLPTVDSRLRMSRDAAWVVCRDTATFDLAPLVAKRRKPSDRARGFWRPALEGPRYFSTESEARKSAPQLSGLLVLPILEVDATATQSTHSFREFLPLEKVPALQIQTDTEFFSREIEHNLTISPECWLGKSWNWDQMEWKIRLAEGHDHTRVTEFNIGQTVVSAVYDMEAELLKLLPSITRHSIIAFFVSQQFSNHLWEFAEIFGQSEGARRIAGNASDARLLTDEARHWVEMEIVRYVHSLDSAARTARAVDAQKRANEARENEELLASYFAKFPGNEPRKGEICVSADQNSSHLSKWRKAADGYRRGSTADRRFREILSQDKRPEEFTSPHLARV